MTPKQWLSVFKQHPQKEDETVRGYCSRIASILPSIGASATPQATVNVS